MQYNAVEHEQLLAYLRDPANAMTLSEKDLAAARRPDVREHNQSESDQALVDYVEVHACNIGSYRARMREVADWSDVAMEMAGAVFAGDCYALIVHYEPNLASAAMERLTKRMRDHLAVLRQNGVSAPVLAGQIVEEENEDGWLTYRFVHVLPEGEQAHAPEPVVGKLGALLPLPGEPMDRVPVQADVPIASAAIAESQPEILAPEPDADLVPPTLSTLESWAALGKGMTLYPSNNAGDWLRPGGTEVQLTGALGNYGG